MKSGLRNLFLNVDIRDHIKAYRSFEWLDKKITRKKNLRITAFGDLIFEDIDKKIYFLDLMEGNIVLIAEHPEELTQLIKTNKFQTEFLLSDLLETLIHNNTTLKPGEVYSFILPMILGGETTSDNVHVMDLNAWIFMIGQIHHQVKYFKPGTQIGQITIDGRVP